MIHSDLTSSQLPDYAIFLPALSGFYATYIGKQRYSEYVENSRIPAHFTHGMESLNYLNKDKGLFKYKWTLYSAGHADLNIDKTVPKEDMIRNRDRANTWMLADSGGFQIGSLKWPGDWKDATCPNASKKRASVLAWMDEYMDYGMILDIPAWVSRNPDSPAITGISNFWDAVAGTHINNKHWMKHSSGACKFLNVLQGETHTEADVWYDEMKQYANPKQYPETFFRGWAMGGQNMCDISLALKRIVCLIHDGLLEKGQHDIMHFLGTSKLEWAVLLTDIQRAVRKYHNENFTITFDCASPFLATANGQVYMHTEIEDRKKWVYRMQPSIDRKELSTSSLSFKDAILQYKCHNVFTDSPITENMPVSDVCVYGEHDLNKLGRVGKTSWDSFSYAIQMGHNIWSHITAVQQANQAYDSGLVPNMLVQEKFQRVFIRDLINEVVSLDDRDRSYSLIDEYSPVWQDILGTRGATGKKTINSKTYFNKLFS